MLLLLCLLTCGLLTYVTPYTGPGGAPASGYCPGGDSCVPPVFCAAHYLSTLYDPASQCYLAPGTPGICCQAHTNSCKLWLGL